MICLSLTQSTLADNTRVLQENKSFIAMAELRADMLSDFFSQYSVDDVCAWAQQHADIPIIFTLRTVADGGKCTPEQESQRARVLKAVLEADVFSYVDVEFDNMQLCTDICNSAEGKKTRIVVAKHWCSEQEAFENDTSNWNTTMLTMAEMYPQAIIKGAIMCSTSAHLVNIFSQAEKLKINPLIKGRYVLAAMGEFGKPTRILTTRTGSLWSYTSLAQSQQAAPGHLDPKDLSTLYAYNSITANTPVFAIIGNPVSHSKSPVFHNSVFREKNLDAVYIHLPVDDCKYLLECISLLNIRGLSVTLPHKQTVIEFLTDKDNSVEMCASCNTVIVDKNKIVGYNTDIPGFLKPLNTLLKNKNTTFTDKRCTIIGSGGTAQALAHCLIQKQVKLLIVNRTVSKAEKLAHKLNEQFATDVKSASLLDFDAIRNYNDILIQASSVGMNDTEKTPLPRLPLGRNRNCLRCNLHPTKNKVSTRSRSTRM